MTVVNSNTTETQSAEGPSRPLKVALIGNPNTGKSTLFNALAGLRARVGNYPGVTVEKKIGRVRWDNRDIDLIDLPGTYSLSPRSLDELVSVDVLLGRQQDVGQVDAVICIVDASNLERNLYLVSQILELKLPMVLVLNMCDLAAARGTTVDGEALAAKLGVVVVQTEAHRRVGLDALQQAIVETASRDGIDPPTLFPEEFYTERDQLAVLLAEWNEPPMPGYLLERMLLDVGGQVETQLAERQPERLASTLGAARERLKEAGCRIPMTEARVRYAWARDMLTGVVTRPTERRVTTSDKIDKVLTHRLAGLLIFCGLMFVVFLSIFTWAEPFMGAIETAQGWVTDVVKGLMPPGALRSLLVDGVIAGVGGVIVFLPQIAFLFFFLAILEDCGYMARAAFLMDKLMTRIGLSGKSFVPLMSSFACAIPGVMATRVIENRRDRMVTMLVAPLMSCSARLPVYVLLIALFLPSEKWIERGLVMFAMYSLGVVVAIGVAWLLKKTFFKGETPPFVMELPSYKWPSPRIVLHRVYDRSKAFVTRAGTLIFATTVIVWACAYFPGDHGEVNGVTVEIESFKSEFGEELKSKSERLSELQEQLDFLGILMLPNTSDDEKEAASSKLLKKKLIADTSPETVTLAAMEARARIGPLQQRIDELNAIVDPWKNQKNQLSAQLIEGSFLGRMGHAIEPVVKPLGWDWKIGVGAIASFPAREVIVATLGTIYSLGSEVKAEDAGLLGAIRNSEWPDGRKVYNTPVALSVMVFFALCAQCAATLMVIRRETNSWRWPIFTFVYMTVLAYVGAFVTYQVGMMFV
jgi:ferrous iron transport protein B